MCFCRARDLKNRELFEKTFPELKARREQQERFTRWGSEPYYLSLVLCILYVASECITRSITRRILLNYLLHLLYVDYEVWSSCVSPCSSLGLLYSCSLFVCMHTLHVLTVCVWNTFLSSPGWTSVGLVLWGVMLNSMNLCTSWVIKRQPLLVTGGPTRWYPLWC